MILKGFPQSALNKNIFEIFLIKFVYEYQNHLNKYLIINKMKLKYYITWGYLKKIKIFKQKFIFKAAKK